MNIIVEIDKNVDVNKLGTITVQVTNKNGANVANVWVQDDTETPTREQRTSDFRKLVQHPEPERLMDRLHELIDGKKGADVGSVLFRCVQEGWLAHSPTQSEFCSEFQLRGSWSAVRKYMDKENGNAWYRAGKIDVL